MSTGGDELGTGADGRPDPRWGRWTASPAIVGPLVLILAALAFAACSGATTEQGGDDVGSDGEGATVAGPGFVDRPTVNLVVNDWTASALNVAVAEQLIERHLGHPVVPVRLDDADEMYDGLADGSLDAALEIWPSAMTDEHRRFFEREQVLDLGPLGSVGKVGWFVPRYVVDADPALATWEGYVDPGVAERFATPATRPRGRFLGTNPDYEQYDAEIIANLGLPFDVEFSGSEQATEAALAAAVEAEEPILVYWWTPTAAVARYDLVGVGLPPRTDACAEAADAGGRGVDCDYPVNQLFKASSIALPAKAPGVLAFLQQFALTTEDQMALLVAVEAGGLTIDEAAADWIAAHPDRWGPWVAEAAAADDGGGEPGDGDPLGPGAGSDG